MVNNLKENKIFAKGVCFDKLFIIFIIGCLFGNYYEMILNLVRHFIQDGSIFWEVRRGVIYGPFSPIYGFGAVIMTLFLAEKDYKWYQILLYGSFLGGFCEYLIGFLQETFIGTISWDYSNYFLDINGRTTIPIMLLWGLFCLFYVKFVYPPISNLVEKIPYKIGKIVLNIFIVFLSLDMLISWSALIRQGLRRNNYPPFTFIGELFDKIYPDERLAKAFPNMVVPEDKVEK